MQTNAYAKLGQRPAGSADARNSGWLRSFIRALRPRFLRRDDTVAELYSGCGWTDETERRLTGDMFR